MAPKIKTHAEDILAAAVQLVREQGSDALNARSLAKKIGCSIQPIFRTFKTMDELKGAVYKYADEIYQTAMMEALCASDNGFQEMGLTYISFAKDERHLFQLLFMSNVFSQGSAANIAGSTTGDDEVVALLSRATGLDAQKAQELYTGIWFTTHGIASLLATNSCTLNKDEIKRILGIAFEGMLYILKNEGADA
jgi:AcrR family transcriptional regulator